MKYCARCNTDKNIDLFPKNNGKSKGSPYCLECMREVNKLNYLKFKEKHNKRTYNKRKESKEKFYDYKKTCVCNKCGEKRWWVLDFHHVDPLEKEFNISTLLRKNHTKLYEELKKCIPLCRNCHTDFHYLEKINKINIEEYLKMPIVHGEQ